MKETHRRKRVALPTRKADCPGDMPFCICLHPIGWRSIQKPLYCNGGQEMWLSNRPTEVLGLKKREPRQGIDNSYRVPAYDHWMWVHEFKTRNGQM